MLRQVSYVGQPQVVFLVLLSKDRIRFIIKSHETRNHLLFLIEKPCVLRQVCNSVFNSWDQFKDHLVSHTGVKPYHCTMCDMWFTHTKDLRTHLRVVHSVEDRKVTEEVIISDSTASATLAIATQSIAGTETVMLDGGIQVEHVTVEPMDLMEIGGTTTVVVGDEEVAEMCEEDVERLKQAGVQIQVVHVTTSEVEQTVVNSQVEVQVEEEMINVEDAEQAVV